MPILAEFVPPYVDASYEVHIKHQHKGIIQLKLAVFLAVGRGKMDTSTRWSNPDYVSNEKKNWLSVNNIQFLKWPRSSVDLSPIENVRQILKNEYGPI